MSGRAAGVPQALVPQALSFSARLLAGLVACAVLAVVLRRCGVPGAPVPAG